MNYNSKLLSMFGQGGSMFGVTLFEAMKENNKIMVLSSDVSSPAGLDKFKAAYPDNFMNMGIAEQNMIGAAAGLTDNGFKTIAVAQSCFISMRSFEPIRQYLGYMESKQILVGFGSGFSLQFFGNTHYALEDISLMRTVPGMTVVAPCDCLEAVKVLEAALEYDAPIYIRLFGGTGIPLVYNEDFDYEIGKSIKLKDGHDIQLVATGSMVSVALKVAEQLDEENVKASVIDMHTIKPLDQDAFDNDVSLIVSLEEHRVVGGLGDAIADYLSQYATHPRLLKIGVPDQFSVVGDYPYLMELNGLSINKIIEKIKSVL
jgi:transketolase